MSELAIEHDPWMHGGSHIKNTPRAVATNTTKKASSNKSITTYAYSCIATCNQILPIGGKSTSTNISEGYISAVMTNTVGSGRRCPFISPHTNLSHVPVAGAAKPLVMVKG